MRLHVHIVHGTILTQGFCTLVILRTEVPTLLSEGLKCNSSRDDEEAIARLDKLRLRPKLCMEEAEKDVAEFSRDSPVAVRSDDEEFPLVILSTE